MTFSIAIRTVPERAELFGSLMARLSRETVPVHVSAVPGPWIPGGTNVSPNENACLALEKAEQDHARWTIFLEDDAGLIDDFMGSVERWMGDFARPDVHVYPLGCQYSENWPKGTPAQAWEYPIKDFYCSVALVIRTTLIPSILSHFRASVAPQGFDLMLGEWHRTVSDSPCLITPIPCFVEHLGDDSTLINGRSNRNVVGRFRGFRGYDYSYRRNGG